MKLLPRVIVLGVGNVLLSDEGAGVHAVQKLKERISHPEIEIIDGGTLGLDLLPYFERAEKLVIIDCARGGGKPGSIYRFGIESLKRERHSLKLSLHDFNLVDVINLAEALNVKLPEMVFYGIEPKSFDVGEKPTYEVEQAIEKVVQMIQEELIRDFGEEIVRKGEGNARRSGN